MIPRLLGECWCNPLTWGEGQKTKSILTSEVYLNQSGQVYGHKWGA